MKPKSRNSLLLAYYGDDFTGSTDVMESLSRAGLKTVLFLRPPTKVQLARFPDLRAFGIAGGSRAMSPAQMARELPPAFQALKASGAPIVHYKTCSTFDSSPRVGSIGKAIELGRRVFGPALTPLVVGAPVLGRYVAFGNLYARSGLDSALFRLDRHPTMSRHPVTPMNEADLRLHLSAQTSLPVELVDLLRLEQIEASSTLPDFIAKPTGVPPVVLFDTTSESQLPVIGRLICSAAPRGKALFVAGSSGIEYALVARWREIGWLGKVPLDAATPRLEARQVVTISGSCSPVTDRQIARAAADGFVEIACDTLRLARRQSSAAAINDAIARAQPALTSGRNVIFQTARGPADSRRRGFERIAQSLPGNTRAEKLALAGESLGHGLANILERALALSGARRAVVCGGDTSTHAARALGIEALEFVAPVAPGGPLCQVHAPGRVTDGCELVFKGGQVGRDSFFLELAGRSTTLK